MFDLLTDRARAVLALARQEAANLNHLYIGSEHILVGLAEEGQGVAARVLRGLGVGFDEIVGAIEQVDGNASDTRSISMRSAGQIPFTPRAKALLEFAVKEAQDLRHNYVGTEHLLLGLLCEGGGTASKVLTFLDLSPQTIRSDVMECLGEHSDPTSKETDDSDYKILVEAEAPYFFDRYQEFAVTTAVYPGVGKPGYESASYCTLGLTGEAGEVAEKVKKRFRLGGANAFLPGSVVDYKGTPETYEQFVEAMKKELGDVLWYVAGLSAELGIKLSDVANGNIEKLSSRKKRGVLKGKGDNR